MDTRKHIVDLESFREMLHISPRNPGQSFAELPFEEEIVEFLSLQSLDETESTGITSGMMYCSLQSRCTKTKASARKKKGGSASSTTLPTPIAILTPTTTVVAAPRLSAAAKDEGTSSKPGAPDVLFDDSEEELSWNSSDNEDVDEQTKGRDESEGDKTDESDDDDDDQDEAEKVNIDNDDEEEISKIGE
nr:hypothetical protein [Tanacetum cinerariifolium]